ncbi:MAG: secondary thiamine-phosphate synthase enzyme YjbQ [Candidatus Acidiferrales bacterium]
MSIVTLALRTARRTELKNVTREVEAAVRSSGVANGVCYLYVPHTTAGVFINEGYDPDVARDMEGAFDRLVPDSPLFRHNEGNSDSHVKTALAGSSAIIFIENAKLALGRWQQIFYAEFDGPRQRELHVKIVRDPG